MRAKLALAAVVAGLATSLAPSPASAICNVTLHELTGFCSPCHAAGLPYGIAEHATGGALPDLVCPQ